LLPNLPRIWRLSWTSSYTQFAARSPHDLRF